MQVQPRLVIAMAFIMIVALAGCASTPKPTTELALAKQSIERAKTNNAYEVSPQRINAAEAKLARSMDYIENGDNKQALQLLQQAQKDAEAALAEVDETRARKSLKELQASMAELESKLTEQ